MRAAQAIQAVRMITAASAPTTVGGCHGPGRFPLVLSLAQRLTLVPVLLTPGQGDLQLGAPADEVQLQWNYGIALGLNPAGETLELAPVQEQLALATRGVIVPGSLQVLGDVGALEPSLTITVQASVKEARPMRSALTSVPVRTSPAS